MIELLHTFDLTTSQWVLAIISGILVGIAKTGIGGAGMLAIPIFAGIFGGKVSAGLLLPLLCVGDAIGVSYYHRHAQWKYILRLLPWTLIGIVAGLIAGHIITDTQFKGVIAFTVIGGIIIMLWQERNKDSLKIPESRWFSILMGLAGGFTTMLGNAAGPVMALYFLSMRMPKYSFIGTWAWFFLIVNYLKIPLHIFFWGTITLRTLSFDAAMLPAIAVGAFIGVAAVKKIPEKIYRYFIIAMTLIAAVKLFM